MNTYNSQKTLKVVLIEEKEKYSEIEGYESLNLDGSKPILPEYNPTPNSIVMQRIQILKKAGIDKMSWFFETEYQNPTCFEVVPEILISVEGMLGKEEEYKSKEIEILIEKIKVIENNYNTEKITKLSKENYSSSEPAIIDNDSLRKEQLYRERLNKLKNLTQTKYLLTKAKERFGCKEQKREIPLRIALKESNGNTRTNVINKTKGIKKEPIKKKILRMSDPPMFETKEEIKKAISEALFLRKLGEEQTGYDMTDHIRKLRKQERDFYNKEKKKYEKKIYKLM